MQVFVYTSRRRTDTYLYLAKHDDFGCVPDAIRAPLEPWRFVLDFELHAQRRMPRIDAATLASNLERQGFYLLFPPSALDPLVAGGVGDG